MPVIALGQSPTPHKRCPALPQSAIASSVLSIHNIPLLYK
jgi:hypothetical protein